jgi:hypothetical protein
VSEELAPLADEEETTAKQVSRRAHLAGVDEGDGEGTAAEQDGRLVGVDLGLAAVDRLHVEGVAEDEVELLARAQVGEPVPAEDALGADDQVGAVGLDRADEGVRLAAQPLVKPDRARRVEHAQVERASVKDPLEYLVRRHPLVRIQLLETAVDALTQCLQLDPPFEA